VLWGATNSNQIKNGKNIKEILVISLVIKKKKIISFLRQFGI